MSTSLIEALLIGSLGIIIGLLLFSMRNKLYYGLYQKALTNLSLGIIIMGIGGGLLSYYTSIDYEKSTIIKAKLKGSEGITAGTTAPVRVLKFQVENPGVTHEITVKPINPLFQNAFEADIYLEIINPDGVQVFSTQQHFEAYEEGHSPHADIERWRHADTTFVPLNFGQYILQVVPITVGIPEIEIWIRDPLKKDGEREFSWR